ncbi:TrbC/VirB2 family protein [uncultured Sphingomonas sp.]|uniref:TrbC/VirB2 family protein n=1 Tax=uncultured Sphingomonas sp. TaxID=158754 RepID=UPI0035CCA9F3
MIDQGTPYPSGLQTALLSSGPVLSDPTGGAPLVDAALWIQHVLLGSTATMVAILAIAAIGFLALSGQIELRRGATTIIGCFILFGAPSIAAAFVQMFVRVDDRPPLTAAKADAPTLPPAPPPPPRTYDPYAGASVERRR